MVVAKSIKFNTDFLMVFIFLIFMGYKKNSEVSGLLHTHCVMYIDRCNFVALRYF